MSRLVSDQKIENGPNSAHNHMLQIFLKCLIYCIFGNVEGIKYHIFISVLVIELLRGGGGRSNASRINSRYVS